MTPRDSGSFSSAALVQFLSSVWLLPTREDAGLPYDEGELMPMDCERTCPGYPCVLQADIVMCHDCHLEARKETYHNNCKKERTGQNISFFSFEHVVFLLQALVLQQAPDDSFCHFNSCINA